MGAAVALSRADPAVRDRWQRAKSGECGLEAAAQAGRRLAASADRLVRAGRGTQALQLPGLAGSPGEALAVLGSLFAVVGVQPPGLPPAVGQWLQVGHAREFLLQDAEAVAAAEGALMVKHPEVAFATAYERLVGPVARRRLGTYFTPPAVVELMTGLLADVCTPASIVDAGAGVGALTLAASSTWASATVHAIDLNPASLGLLAIAHQARLMRLMGSTQQGSPLVLICDDYLQWVQAGWDALPRPRVLLANPPYTRHQARSLKDKQVAAAAASALVPFRTAGLSTFILAATLARMAPEDAMCVLLPDNWLQASYASFIREQLWRATNRQIDLVALPEGRRIFPDARIRAMLLRIGPVGARGSVMVHAATTHASPIGLEQLASSESRPRDAEEPLARLWRASVHSSDTVATRSGTRLPLHEVVHLRRGVATGSNATFLLTDSQADALPEPLLRRAVHRLRPLEGDVLDLAAHDKLCVGGRRCWLVDVPDPDAPEVRDWAHAAVAAGIPTGELCRRRTVWSRLDLQSPPALILGPSSTGGQFRVVENRVGAQITNNLFGMAHTAADAGRSLAWARLAEWLRCEEAQVQWRAVAKVHSGGLLKMEPRAARSILVPVRVATEFRDAGDRSAAPTVG